jgi:hypothetical protein
MSKRYIHRRVGKAELRSLVALAKAEEYAFFQRNPHLVRLYRGRLLAVALCQGAALQYLGCSYGINDFDVHYFYAQHPAKPRLSRAVKRIRATVGTFDNVPVDFIRTVVPAIKTAGRRSAAERINAFLRDRPTSNARHLAGKAVVGLLPNHLFGRVLWGARRMMAEALP